MKLISNSIGALIILGAFVFYHVQIEELSVNLGLSWTFSKMIPYLLEFILVVLLGTILAQFFNGSRVLQKFIMVASVVIFSGIAFAIHPIYEGDFANHPEELVATSDDIKTGLTMVALPGCPFCLERISTLNALHEQLGDLPITVVMLEGDTIAIGEYIQRLNPGIGISPALNSKLLGELTEGSYPSFFFQNRGAFVYRWNQVGFGTGALDWLAEQD